MVKQHAQNYGLAAGIGVPLAIILEFYLEPHVPANVRAAIIYVLGLFVTRMTHWLRPVMEAAVGRLVRALRGPPAAVWALLALPAVVTSSGCATTDCNQIFANARNARTVAVATGAGGVSGALATIPAEGKDAELAIAITAAVITAASVAAGVMAGSYSDEHAAYCSETTRTSTTGS